MLAKQGNVLTRSTRQLMPGEWTQKREGNSTHGISILAWMLFLAGIWWSRDSQAQGPPRPNILFIAVDDLRPDLGAYGVPHARTPNLDALASQSRIFTNHFVQVPTCGASRCGLMRGCYPRERVHLQNTAIRNSYDQWGSQSLPAWMKKFGYRTFALGKIGHYPGGLTGKDWNEGPEEMPGAWDRCWIPKSPWNTAEAMMHGYAKGVARVPGKSLPWENAAGDDHLYPDAWVADEAIQSLEQLSSSSDPWFFSLGFFKPHLPFAAPEAWSELHRTHRFDLPSLVTRKPPWNSGWHESSEFRRNYGHKPGEDPASNEEYALRLRRAYAACVSYVDAQIGRVLDQLKARQMDRNTIIVVWGDHGFLLGEHAIWGKHCLYERALRSPLIIRTPELKEQGRACQALAETVDVFPTLCDLAQVPIPENLDGLSLKPYLLQPNLPSAKVSKGYWTEGQKTIRDDRWRLILGEDGKRIELFDLEHDPEETENRAEAHPEIVEKLRTHFTAIR